MYVQLYQLYFSVFLASIPEFMTNKIVGGQTAPRPIPWQVSIRSHGSHFCGGTILDATTVLSAGHCFDGGNRNGLSILAGTVNRKDQSGQVSDYENTFTYITEFLNDNHFCDIRFPILNKYSGIKIQDLYSKALTMTW